MFKLIMRTVLAVAVVVVVYKILISSQFLDIDWPKWGYAVPLALICVESIWQYKTHAKVGKRR